jgi:hypothetical protein
MGGDVAFAIKRKNRVSTRIFTKHASLEVSTQRFFEGQGEIWTNWKKSKAQPLAPYSYGLTVVDFDTKWVGSIQSYCSLFQYDVYSNARRSDASLNEDPELKALWDAGRVENLNSSSYTQDIKAQKAIERAVGLLGKPFDDVFPELINCVKEGNLYTLVLNTSPPKGWVFDQFESTQYDLFYQHLRERGFKFKDIDIEEWKTFLENDENGFCFLDADLQQRNLQLSTPPVSVKLSGPRRRF